MDAPQSSIFWCCGYERGWFKERKKRKVNQLIYSHTGTGDVRYLENGLKEMLVKLSYLEDCGW